MLVFVPLQRVSVATVKFKSGTGATITVKLKASPSQAFLRGVMVYLTTAVADLDELTSTSVIGPVPVAELPVTVPETTFEVQLNVLLLIVEKGV
jgi:hypothetical protein